jgi:hypothetical protein
MPVAAVQLQHPQGSWLLSASTNVAYRKLTFKKGTLPAKKLEEMAPVIRELK